MHAVRYPSLQPLPGEDELPYSFGPNMDSDEHRENMTILVGSLQLHLQDRKDTYVTGGMALYFGSAQIKKNDFIGPDVFVVLGTSNRARKSWVCWEELKGPDLVIELLSESTENNDRTTKMEIYARTLRVGEYYLYDPLDGRFEAYRLDPRGWYVAVNPDEDGSVLSAVLNLRLAPHDEEFRGELRTFLRWFTRDGRLIPTGAELATQERARAEQATARAEQATARAEQATARAEQATARAEALAAKLRALGIDPEG